MLPPGLPQSHQEGYLLVEVPDCPSAASLWWGSDRLVDVGTKLPVCASSAKFVRYLNDAKGFDLIVQRAERGGGHATIRDVVLFPADFLHSLAEQGLGRFVAQCAAFGPVTVSAVLGLS